MLRIKEFIYGKLSSDAALLALVGIDQIMFFYPRAFDTFPIVTYNEVDQSDAPQGYRDDEPNEKNSTVQIDIWVGPDSAVSTTDIAIEIDRIMHSILYNNDASFDNFETDTAIEHKVLRYRRTIGAEDLI